MKKNVILLLLTTLLVFRATAQTNEKKDPVFGISFSAYVKTDVIFDSRQTVNLREGHLLYYPENQKLDAEGKDINAKSNFNILAIQSRLSGKITGPDALGAKTSGVMEGEFFGNINSTINSFRLRQAYLKLNWKTTELLAGQYWHPMFVASCFPEVVAVNTGLPFLVFTRNPQIRLTQDIGKFKILATALTQIDFTSTGPDGTSPKYLRNSSLPEMNLQLQYSVKSDEKGKEFLVGGSADYLLLTPSLTSEVVLKKAYDTVVENIVIHHDAEKATYKTSSKTGSFSANFFTKIKQPKFTIKLGGVYTENGYSFSMLGGYVVKEMSDSAKGTLKYANVRTLSGWTDIMVGGSKWQFAVFGGYSKNIGAGTNVIGPYYSRGSDIAYLYRISPRIVLNANKFRLSGEFDYTVAAYGKTMPDATVSNPKEIGNFRVLVGLFYFF